MHNNPLVSIGITTYKRPGGLRNALRKFTNQTYSNLQIIISDDDPDGTENQKVFEEFSKDERVEYYKKRHNEGMNLNFIHALRKAKGTFFLWAADDDDWDNSFVETCVQALLNNEKAVLCITNTAFIDENYVIQGKSKENIDTVGLDKKERFKKYFRNSKIHNVGFYGVYRAEGLKKSYLPNYLSNDRLVLLELSLRGEFIQLETPGFYYNISGSSKGIKSYLNAMRIESKLIENAPHLAFNLLHFKSILYKWDKIGLFLRIELLFIYLALIKENKYLRNSKNEIKRYFNRE